MKPKTMIQKEVARLSATLRPISPSRPNGHTPTALNISHTEPKAVCLPAPTADTHGKAVTARCVTHLKVASALTAERN